MDIVKHFGRLRKSHSRSKRQIDWESNGLLEIVQDAREKHHAIDIIAVHGLARGFDSWVSTTPGGRTQSWLEGLLAKEQDFPSLRIIKYNYDCKALSAQLLIRKVLYGKAVELLRCLVELRQTSETSRRPIVFIAHDLGGWIVHRALLLSSEASDANFKDIEFSTAGLVLLGTPDPSAPPETLPRVVQEIRRLSSPFLALDRERDSDILMEINWLSREIEGVNAILERLSILSFYECENTNGLGQVVSETSTRAPATEHKIIRVRKRCNGLISFKGRGDENYQLLVRELRDSILFHAAHLIHDKWEAHDMALKVQVPFCEWFRNHDYAILAETNRSRPEMLTRSYLVEELRTKIRREAPGPRDSLRVANIRGNSGVGKTTVAAHYGAAIAEDVSFVFFLDSKSPDTIVASFLDLAAHIVGYYARKYYYEQGASRQARAKVEEQLGLPNTDEMTAISDVKQLDAITVRSMLKGVKNWLFMEGNQWLLVFDNVPDDVSRVTDTRIYDVMDYIPWALQGQIILVSQGPRGCGIGSTLTVPDWDKDDAAELLYRRLALSPNDTGAKDEIIKDIVSKLDLNPLSVSCAANHMQQYELTPKHYSLRLSGQPLMFKTKLSSLQSRILGVLGILPCVSIPVKLFAELQQGSQSTSPVLQVLHQFLKENIAQRVPRSRFEDSTQLDSDDCIVSLKSTRVWIMEFWNQSEAAWQTCNACAKLLARSYYSRTAALNEEATRDLLLPHVQACAKWITESVQPGKFVDWHILGDFCFNQGAKDAAISYFELAVKREVFGKTKLVDRVQIYLSLASLYHQRGDHKSSRDLLTQIEIVGVSPLNLTSTVLSYRVKAALAMGKVLQGDYQAAERYYSEIEQSQQKEFGFLSLQTIETATRLAAVYKRVGRWEESVKLQRRIRTCYRDVLGEAHMMTLYAAEELALTLQLTGSFAEAADLYRMSINKKKERLGQNHPSTGASMAKYAALCDVQGKFGKADEFYQSARKIFDHCLSKTHPLTLATIENEALSYRARSNFMTGETRNAALDEAERLYLEVITQKCKENHLYSEKDVVSTRAKLYQMYCDHEYFRKRTENHLLTFGPLDE